MAKMTKVRLLALLEGVADDYDDDAEAGHRLADDALVEFINDPEIERAFKLVYKMYD